MNTSKSLGVFIVLFFVFITSANAHFKFENPPPRGSDESTITQAPCGGYNTVNTSAIAKFPITQGQVTTDFEDGNGSLTISYAPNINATFTPVSGNVSVNIADGAAPKQITTPVDISKAGAKVGDQGVLQAVFVGSETWYECADVMIVDALKNGAPSSFVGTSQAAFLAAILASFVMAF